MSGQHISHVRQSGISAEHICFASAKSDCKNIYINSINQKIF